MSQVETPTNPMLRRLQGPKGRLEGLLKTFEWTWTNAVVFSLGLTFFLLISTSVMPSFWLYFADQKLKWDGGAPQKLVFWSVSGFWLKELRDAVAMGLATGPIITVLVVAAILQNWRRKLRGTGASRASGGYR